MSKSVIEFLKQMHGWSFPVDPEKICMNMNVSFERVELPRYLTGYYDKEKRTIFINKSKNRYYYRFALAMALREVMVNEQVSRYQKEKFAFELLMPAEEFIEYWNKQTPAQVMESARYFDLSPELVIKRAKQLIKEKKLVNQVFKNFSDLED